MLTKNIHHSIHLQRAYNIDGEHNFIFDVFDTNLTYDEMRHREPLLIKLFESYNDKFGYNMLIEYKGTSGVKFSKERCSNISNALKGRTAHNKGKSMSDDQKLKLRDVNIKKYGKEIDVYDVDGNFITTEPSISTIYKNYPIDKRSVQRVLSGAYSQFKGYIFKYHKNCCP